LAFTRKFDQGAGDIGSGLIDNFSPDVSRQLVLGGLLEG